MYSITRIKFALPSLLYSVLMGLTTLFHHLHSALVLHPQSSSMHIVWNEIFIIPATLLSMYFFLKNGNRLALLIYLIIALLGFVFLGLYEGGWNHVGKLIAYLRIDSPYTQLRDILPANNLHYWFYELTGVLTFILALIASWYSACFFIEVRRHHKVS